MPRAVPIRTDIPAAEPRRRAKIETDGRASRRTLALASAFDGASREDAARQAGMDRQSLRVLRGLLALSPSISGGRSLAAPPSHTTGRKGPYHGGSLDQAALGVMDGRPSEASSAFESAMLRAGLAAILPSMARRPSIRSMKWTRSADRGGGRARCPRFVPRAGAVRPVWTVAGTGSTHCAIASRRLQRRCSRPSGKSLPSCSPAASS